MFGLIAGAITEAQIYNENKNNIHYVINMEFGAIPHLLNKYYMEFILREYPDLLNECLVLK